MTEKTKKVILSDEDLQGVTGGLDCSYLSPNSKCKEKSLKADCEALDECVWVDNQCKATLAESIGNLKEELNWD